MHHEAVGRGRKDGDVAGIWKIILASSAGTLIEWYDFYIFGSLATILASQFFPKNNPTAGLLFTLATFATGFVVRPFGALFFGRMGDLVGRKHTFLLTLVMMGMSTFAIGLIPTYESIGVLAPIIVLALRLLQGLALGGEYGGAATYVAEHAPSHRQGFFTSFIQTTATLGLFVSLLVILVTRTSIHEVAFNEWGWRIPFLLSSVLVAFSYVLRRRMEESPQFAELKATGSTSKNPLVESFVQPENRRRVMIALFGATMGQGVVWYTGQFYALYFLQTVMNIEGPAANKIIAWGLIFGTPFFILFGALSDRIGRKKLIMAGLLLATVGYLPIYGAMQSVGTPTGPYTMVSQKVESTTDPITKAVKRFEMTQESSADGAIKNTKKSLAAPKPGEKPEKPKVEIVPTSAMFWMLVGLVWLQVIFVTLVYGPIAAFLVELFPTKIRYTSMSLPYHIGNGVFGGLVPFIGTAVVDLTGNKLSGVYYPIGIAALTFVIGMALIKERPTEAGFEEAAP
jgi:MFS family permease